MRSNTPPKLLDCDSRHRQESTELFIVEGDSAASAVGRARDATYQAVLPMQGKPLNAWRASKTVVARNEFFQAVIAAIGANWDDDLDLANMRYDRIVLLFDPDADGIHCGMLLLMFFYRWMRPMLELGHIYMVHPPLYEIQAAGLEDSVCAASEQEAAAKANRLQSQGFKNVTRKKFRGLASMGDRILWTQCISPQTRHIFRMRPQDATAAIQAFTGQRITPDRS